jgi:hypothetical protein
MLLSVEVNQDVCKQCCGLSATSLSSQLAVLSIKTKYITLQQAQAIVQHMIPEVRCLFTQVERLIRLRLVCPRSSNRPVTEGALGFVPSVKRQCPVRNDQKIFKN